MDADALTWSAGPVLEYKRSSASAIVLPNGNIILAGGGERTTEILSIDHDVDNESTVDCQDEENGVLCHDDDADGAISEVHIMIGLDLEGHVSNAEDAELSSPIRGQQLVPHQQPAAHDASASELHEARAPPPNCSDMTLAEIAPHLTKWLVDAENTKSELERVSGLSQTVNSATCTSKIAAADGLEKQIVTEARARKEIELAEIKRIHDEAKATAENRCDETTAFATKACHVCRLKKKLPSSCRQLRSSAGPTTAVQRVPQENGHSKKNRCSRKRQSASEQASAGDLKVGYLPFCTIT